MTSWKTTARAFLAIASLAMLAACDGAIPARLSATATARPSDSAAWPASPVADPSSLGFSSNGLAALDTRLATSVGDQDVAGMVTLLARKGEVAQFKAYGVQSGDPRTGTAMTRDSIFRIYSMTKPITGVALMQLYEKGLWQLDDPVTKHAPELARLKLMTGVDARGNATVADPSRAPTMREIMSHTAGFGYGLSGNDPVNAAFRDQRVLASKDLDDMMMKIARIPLLYEPGTRWSYSVAVDIQGYVVQRLSGRKSATTSRPTSSRRSA
jgi:CubicO group peptidase (beta-lactamase class C family)